MNAGQHLSRTELDRLISEDGASESTWLESSTSHLEECRDCRVSLLLGETESKIIPRTSAEGPCPGEARLKRAASGASDGQTALHVVQHCTTCDDCAKKLKEYAKLFSGDSKGDLKGLKTSKPEWQKEFARQLAASQKTTSLRLRLGMAGWTVALLLIVAVAVVLFLQRDSINKVNQLVASAFTESRNTDLRLLGADYSEPHTEQGNAIINSQPLTEARAALARLRPKMDQRPEFLAAEGRADLASNQVQGAYEKLKRARAQSPNSTDILNDLAVAECMMGDNGQPDLYRSAYELLSQVLEADSKNVVALFNRAIVAERLREYAAAVEDWKRLLELESKGGWADEARRRKSVDEDLSRQQHSQLGNARISA